jgi:hypothetical protein
VSVEGAAADNPKLVSFMSSQPLPPSSLKELPWGDSQAASAGTKQPPTLRRTSQELHINSPAVQLGGRPLSQHGWAATVPCTTSDGRAHRPKCAAKGQVRRSR